jgi:CHAT domain-containing protein
MDSTKWNEAAQRLNRAVQGGDNREELDAAIAGLSQALQTEIPAIERLEAFSTLAQGFRQRFLLCGLPSDILESAKAAKQAVDSRPNVPLGLSAIYFDTLTDLYETSGDLGALGTAKDTCENLIRNLGTGPFEPPVPGLARTLLLHYRRSGILTELQETYGLVLPLRYARVKPPTLCFYVYGCACREFYHRSGSVPQLEESIKALAVLNQPEGTVSLGFVAEYAEALIDRYRVFPAPETLDLAINLTGTTIDKYKPAAGTSDCQLALGYAYFLRASAAEHPEETYEGAPILYAGLDKTAAAAVRILQSAADSMLENAPHLPLCLARLGEAQILLSRFNRDPQLREQALSNCERAAALLPPGSTDTAAVHRRLASALKWRDGNSLRVEENYALAARHGATSDLLESLMAAVEWSRLEPLRAFPYVDAILDSLYGQLKVEGHYTLDLIQESTIWIGDGGIIGGRSEIKRWHRPSWMNLLEGVSGEVAYAWAQAGRPQEAIIAHERQPMVVLDCGRAGTAPPGWPQILDAAAVCPLVYLVASASGGCALVLDSKQSPAAKSVLLPNLTSEAVATWLHGPSRTAKDLEGFEYASGYIPGPSDPGKGGLIAAYTFWQLDAGKKNQELWFRPLEECGKWLGEILLPALEHAVDAKQIVLIPTGELTQLPLASAWVEDATRPTGRRYLSDSFTVRYAPSARVLLRPPLTAAPDSFLGVSDPKSKQAPTLTYAPAEIAVASSTFPSRQILSDSAATVMAFQAGASAAGVIHLSCHAFSNFQYANDSMILFADDDVLPLWDVVRMDFSHANLIVLSACESGKITRKTSDQAVSFSSAFLGAGAAAVIATGWNIDDPATCVLVLRFYYNWRISQMQPAAALQEAQQWLRDTTNDEKVKFCETLLPDFGGNALFDLDAINSIYQHLALLPPAERSYSHPHYWAAFMYSGRERAG